MANSNYDNRTVDLLIFQDNKNIPGSGLQEARLSIFADDLGNGKIVTGVAKLAQKAVVLLMTHTHLYDRFWGSEFPSVVFGISSVAEVKRAIEDNFPVFTTSVISLLRSQENTQDPDDEKLREMELENLEFDFNAGSIAITVKIGTLSGDSTTLVIPISKPILT